MYCFRMNWIRDLFWGGGGLEAGVSYLVGRVVG